MRCPARLHANGPNVLRHTVHTHAPDVRKEHARLVMEDVRKTAATSDERTKRIVATSVAKIKTVVSKPALPTVRGMSRVVQRIKAKAVTEGRKNPMTLAELKLDGKFAETVKGENFVLFDNEDAANRIVIFATAGNVKFLLSCVDWYMDGTFSTTPPLFKQVYTIHGESRA